jgi:hypothetical protein
MFLKQDTAPFQVVEMVFHPLNCWPESSFLLIPLQTLHTTLSHTQTQQKNKPGKSARGMESSCLLLKALSESEKQNKLMHAFKKHIVNASLQLQQHKNVCVKGDNYTKVTVPLALRIQ